MKNYNNFINEETLINFLEKGFVKTITLLSKDKQSTMSKLISSITKSTTLINSINLVKTTIGNNFLVNKIGNIEQLKTVANDDIIAIDMILKTLSKKHNKDKLLPINFLNDINDNQLKKTLLYDTEKQFLIQLPYNINLILTQILTNAGVDKEIIENKLNKKINEAQEVQHIDNVDKLDDDPNIDVNDENNEDNEDNVDDEKKEHTNDIDFDKVTTTYSNYQKNIFNLLLKKLKKFNLDEEKELKNPRNF
jgi:hypothetical protein